MTTKETSNIVIPGEWEQQTCLWTAWPAAIELWQADLEPARLEVANLVKNLAQYGLVKVLVQPDSRSSAEKMLSVSNVSLQAASYGDIWLRDSGPIFAKQNGQKIALQFRFNGWGEKYLLEHDQNVAVLVAKLADVPTHKHEFILEGGALEHDGQGTIITTKECLLNNNRNPGYTQEQVEQFLYQSLGAKRVIWLERGLLNDHTDGHIDNLARFSAPGKIICQSPSGADDPNAAILLQIAQELKQAQLEVQLIPSPGRVNIIDPDQHVVAVSHMNFIIFNGLIVMPSYEAHYSKQAQLKLQEYFPKHKVVSLPANHLVAGGGSFHCITQQEIEAC